MIQQKIRSIGVLGSEQNTTTYHIIKEIFTKSGYIQIYKNENNTITIMALKDELVLLMDLNLDTVINILSLGVYFDILVHTSLRKDEYDNPQIKDIVNKAKYIIMNIDEEESIKILEKDIEGLIITYGLNQKATITASSFDTSNNVQFNLCLQREFTSINGEKIEPMEIPLSLDLIGKSIIYYGLASVACGLSYGLKVKEIRNSLYNMKGIYRRLEKVYHDDYIIIDNNCSMPTEYNLTFEETQNIKYKSIYIINGIEIDQGLYTIKKNLQTILNWIPILDIKKIFFYIDKKDDLITDNIDFILTSKNIDYEIYFQLDLCIHNAMTPLERNDLLLLMGNGCLENGRKLINQLINKN